MLSREQQGFKKSGPGGDHYCVGCQGQTHISLPEQIISDLWHLMVRGYQSNAHERKSLSRIYDRITLPSGESDRITLPSGEYDRITLPSGK